MKIQKKNQYVNYSISLMMTAGTVMCLLFFSAISVWAEPLSLGELLAKIQERYEQTEDLKTRFIQEITIKAMKKTDREEGMLYIKPPDKMLWHYSKPQAKKLIINPRKSWLYVPEDNVVYVQDARQIFKSKLIVKFLSGIGKLDEDFRATFSTADPVDENGNYLVTLMPKESDFGVERLFLIIDKDSFQIRQCSFSDFYGNTTRIRFLDIKLNTKMPDHLFTFKPPRGVEVLSLP